MSDKPYEFDSTSLNTECWCGHHEALHEQSWLSSAEMHCTKCDCLDIDKNYVWVKARMETEE